MTKKWPVVVSALVYILVLAFLTNIVIYWLGLHPNKTLRGHWLNISLAVGFLAAFVALIVALWKLPPKESPAEQTSRFWGPFLALGATIAVVAYFWPFDLDDKWIYYRISANVLATGLPLWNASDPIFVGASFIYPYLLAPGHFLGDWPIWEIYQKTSGVLTHLLCAAVIFWHFRKSTLGLLAATTLALFMPTALWSLGGLDVTFATLWLLIALTLYLRVPSANVLFWFLCGCMMWIRPDGILVGVGAWVAQFLRDPRPLGRHFVRGFSFSVPILAYFGVNYLKSGMPLPTVFYVKGWNKAFSGNYPLHFDMYIGGTHMVSAILTSLGITLFIVLTLANLGRLLRFQRSGWLWQGGGTHAPHADLLFGCLLYLGYHVVGGYQHMNFAFRYWLPGIACVAVIGADLFRAQGTSSRINLRGQALIGWLQQPKIFLLFTLTLTLQTFTIGYYAKHIDITPTISPLRDKFSIMSYAGYIRSWMDAGNYLRPKVTENDRIFLYAGMASGAFTNAYLVDQFYLPPHLTRFEDLRNTMPQPPRYDNVIANYEYVLSNPGQFSLETHETDKEFATITVLKRKDFGAPVFPTDFEGFRVDGSTFQLGWTPLWNNLGYIIEARAGEEPFREVGRTNAGYSQLRVSGRTVGQSTYFRIRGTNRDGVSEPSPEIFIE